MMKQIAATVLALSAGCASSADDGPLLVSGRLGDPSKVTHVVASNPTNASRVVSEMKADGQFALALAPGYQWVLTFADASKTGKDMQVATLQARGLDALAPQTGGKLDLGVVTLGASRATATVAWATLIGALGIDDATATRLGRTDDLALRYANPDIDNDGILDALQAGHAYRLDLAGQFTLTTEGRDVTISDMIRGTYGSASVRYAGTSLQAAVPSAMGMNLPTGTITFDRPFYGTAMGPNTEMVEPGTEIGQPHVKFGELDGTPMVGVVARSGHDAPSGTYEFGFANGQLTFSDVYAPSASSTETARDYAVPFVRIRTVREGCTANCGIAALEIDWRINTANGWESAEPRAARIELVTKRNGNDIYLAANLDADQTALSWSEMPVRSTGILASELAYVSTANICYFAVSYVSELGMKMTSQVQNPACY